MPLFLSVHMYTTVDHMCGHQKIILYTGPLHLSHGSWEVMIMTKLWVDLILGSPLTAS